MAKRRKAKARLNRKKEEKWDKVVGKGTCRWCGRKDQDVNASYSDTRFGILFCDCGRVSMLALRDLGKPVKMKAQRVIDGAREMALKAQAGRPRRRKLKARR